MRMEGGGELLDWREAEGGQGGTMTHTPPITGEGRWEERAGQRGKVRTRGQGELMTPELWGPQEDLKLPYGKDP